MKIITVLSLVLVALASAAEYRTDVNNAMLYVAVVEVASNRNGTVDAAVYTMPANTLAANGQGVVITACYKHSPSDYNTRPSVIFNGVTLWSRTMRKPLEFVCVEVTAARAGDASIWYKAVEIGSKEATIGVTKNIDFKSIIFIKSSLQQQEDGNQGEIVGTAMKIEWVRKLG